jgi:ABC-type nitrate/sulfonate/bicarbonate transport system permease component
MRAIATRGARLLALNLLVLAGVWGLWQVAARASGSTFFPGPGSVVEAFREILGGGDIQGFSLWDHVWASLVRVLAGFGVATVTGVALGMVLGLRRTTYEATKAVLEPLRFIPPIAWIPLAIVLMRGFSRYAFIIWIGAFFPILVGTMAGILRVSPLLVDVCKVFGARRLFIVLRVVVPGALPEIVAGMRIGLGVGWMCIVAAEMIGGDNVGLGRLMMNYADLLRVDMVIVGMITIGVIGYVTNELLILVERRLFPWRQQIRL